MTDWRKYAFAVPTAVMLGALGIGMSDAKPTDDGDNDRAVHSGVDDRREFVGNKRCRMCHTQWFESWRETSKANAFESLKPNVGASAKERAGLDVAKDYTTDSRCLRCHSVGFGEPGGYATPAADDKKAERHARLREGVGCEACHGPGSDYIQVMREILLEERPYRRSELVAKGRRVVGKAVCLSCHNDSAPCMKHGKDEGRAPSYEFTVDLDNPAGFHKRFELEYRVSE